MPAPFADFVAFLTALLDRRTAVVDGIERLALNVQHKDTSRRRDRAYFEQLFHSAVAGGAALPRSLASLNGALTAAHVDDGFRPVLRERQAHTLDPLELLIRAYDYWDATRWPGRNGRTTFAQVLFSVFVTGQLELLTMRAWDDGEEHAKERLLEAQGLLDRLNDEENPCVLVRDTRWLLQTAQGPLTSDLAAYFRVAERIATLDEQYRLEIHRAGARLAGGHLRSQQRYRSIESGRPASEAEVLATTRNSNAMDTALLVWDLVALLEAYQTALDTGGTAARRRLADAIVQGLSADPELFVTRIDLLGPATIVEEVFVDAAGRTAVGERHADLIARYRRLLTAVRDPLTADCLDLDPAGRHYSPLGISYGFCADMMSNFAVGVLSSQRRSELALEDLFDSRTGLDEKADRAQLWESLPVRGGEAEHFSHSEQWAQQVFDGLMQRLRERGHDQGPQRTSRLFIVTGDGDPAAANDIIPAGAVSAQEHLITSDVQGAMARGATAFPRSHVVADRKEGRYLASVEQDGKWFAVSKVVLTTHLAQGTDAVIRGVPETLAQRLQVSCPEILGKPTSAPAAPPAAAPCSTSSGGTSIQ